MQGQPGRGGHLRTLVDGWLEVGAREVTWDGHRESGRRSPSGGTPWKELVPADPSGVLEILGVVITPDRRFYAYTYLRALTELYVVEGLK